MQLQINDFIPMMWPEDRPRAKDTEDYEKCEVCTAKSRIIWGEGNPDASIFIILDNPGQREDKDGCEYLCGTRETLQLGLHKAGIPAKDVYLTYILKCRPLKAYDKERARAFSMPFLVNQIEKAKPKLLICLGDVVVQCILGDKDAHVKNLRGKIHELMGYPAIVSYHPLAVRRRPNLFNIFVKDLCITSNI